MTVSVLSPVSFTSYFDPNTPAPLQANLYFYFAGTLDPISVYQEANLGVTYDQPVRTTWAGRVPPVWVGEIPNGYRVRVFDQYSVLLEDVDNIPGATPAYEAPVPPAADATKLYATGDIVYSFSYNLARAGFVFCNGTSIGNAGSAATQRQNADCLALFKHLWQQDASGVLTITPGGRGASADGDWAANKAIATPNHMGRLTAGIDAMGGAVATGLLASIPYTLGNIGSPGGTAGVTAYRVYNANLEPHAHTLYDPGHTHTGWTGDHTHSASAWTDAQGAHGHNISIGAAGHHDHGYTRASPVTGYVGYFEGFAGPAAARTDGAGEHTHSASADIQGSHGHNVGVSVAAVGNIGVGIAAAGTGMSISGFAGGNVPLQIAPPLIQFTVYIRL